MDRIEIAQTSVFDCFKNGFSTSFKEAPLKN